MNMDNIYHAIVNHYEDCLEKHGDSHLGVDWPKIEDANTRYRIMLELIDFKRKITQVNTLLDFGCGASHLYEYMKLTEYSSIKYNGLDISSKFIELSTAKYPFNKYFCLDVLTQSDLLPKFDYIIMNGVFTEKRELSFDQMFDYFKMVTRTVFQKAEKGLAFNVMSKAVDWERWDLFHLPTDLLIDFLTKDLSRNFIIRNDYGLYEYTVYLYK
jgi:SAM-dependent methyltransferase